MSKEPKAPVRFELRISDAISEAIDEWRREQPDLPNRTEAVRRLIELGLASRPKKKGATR